MVDARKLLLLGTLLVMLTACDLKLEATPTPSIFPTTPSTIATRKPLLTESPTETLTPMIAFTPLPTYDPDNAWEIVLQKLDNNDGCVLPCWWGIEPGKTEFQDSIRDFDRFEDVTIRRYLDLEEAHDFLSMKFFPPGLHINIGYTTIDGYIDVISISSDIRDEVTLDSDFDDPRYEEYFHNYTLESILMALGKPNEIYLRSFKWGPEWFYSHTVLFYPEIGVLVDYESENRPVSIEGIMHTSTCPSNGFISLKVFDPKSDKMAADLIEPLGSFEKYRLLSEATNMSVQQFYEVFKSSDCENEIVTPMDLWPDNPNE